VGDALRFRREGKNAFTRATRVIATKEALRERELGGERIAEIMQRTVAHVGANELSEQEWIATALRYAETLAPSEASHGGGDQVARSHDGSHLSPCSPSELEQQQVVHAATDSIAVEAR
jgi:hypothetical protein